MLITYFSYWYATSIATRLIADGSLRLEPTQRQLLKVHQQRFATLPCSPMFTHVHQCSPMMFTDNDLPQSQQERHHCPRGLSQFQDLPIEDLVSRFVSDNCWRDLPRPLIRRSREICSHCSDYLGIQMESCLLNMALL